MRVTKRSQPIYKIEVTEDERSMLRALLDYEGPRKDFTEKARAFAEDLDDALRDPEEEK